MKKILLLSVVLCTLFVAQAQRVYFVYLQSENRSPFFVKMGDKVYSSSTEGYLIVPKLIDSTYSFVIGKANRSVPETRFSVPINKNDRGFLIREADNKLSLFDFQTMAVLEASASSNAGVSYTKKTDDFTKLLALAADDTTLLNVPIVTRAETPKKEKETVVAKAPAITAAAPEAAATEPDTAVASNAAANDNKTDTNTAASAEALTSAGTVNSDTGTTAAASVQNNDKVTATTEDTSAAKIEEEKTASPAAVEAAPEYQRSMVTRRSESSTSDGFGLVFLDKNENETDTIRILIPNPKITFGNVAAEQPEDPKKFLDITHTAASADTVATAKTEEPAAVQGSSCAATATESDMAKLRKSMSAKASEDDIVAEAEKQFKNKCFTTEQVKDLSTLILTPKGKYTLFRAAYPHVSDQKQFAVLESELKADYFYMNRFKALIAQ